MIMHWNRRRFLALSTTAAGGTLASVGFWIGRSRSRAARFFRERFAETRRQILPAPQKPFPATWDENRITVAWLGHATVLINFYGIVILTDPVFSRRVGPDFGIGVFGPKRFIAPALEVHELPSIDVVLLSHAHLDHLDLPSLHALPDHPWAVTASVTSDLLTSTPVAGAGELRWGEQRTFHSAKGELRVKAFEVKHWGARWRQDNYRGYNGYLLSREGKTVIFGGDTAYTASFRELHSQGPFELAIMPIAAYRPWIWNHCTPEEAVRMADEAGADYLLPVHHSTFKLSDEPMAEPMERLRAVLAHEPERLAIHEVGGTFSLS